MGGTKMSKTKGNVAGPGRRSSTRTAPTRCASTSSSWAPPTRTWSGRTAGSRGSCASSAGSGGSCTRSPRAGAGDAGADTPLVRKAHETIARVTDDIDRRVQFHTPISAVMELVNELSPTTRPTPARASPPRPRVSLLQPYAPHVTEELWEALGHERLWEQPWPVADPAHARPRHVRARRPGERQGARPDRGPGRPRPRTSWSSGPRPPHACRRTWTARRSGRRSSCRASS